MLDVDYGSVGSDVATASFLRSLCFHGKGRLPVLASHLKEKASPLEIMMTMRLVPAQSKSIKYLYQLPWHRLEQKDLPILIDWNAFFFHKDKLKTIAVFSRFADWVSWTAFRQLFEISKT